MTTFTTPHSLPLLEASDKIAASGDGLREDLNAISAAANSALESVKGYTTTEITAARAYTDERDEAYRAVDRALWRAEDDGHQAAAEANAAAYTNAKDTAARAYTDERDEAYRVVDRALWRSEDDGHEAAAKAYADTQDTAKLATARAYTDTRESVLRTDFATSHVALDSDGTPFFQYGSMTVRVLQDTDGTPYYEAA